jgi:hypothetical protein
MKTSDTDGDRRISKEEWRGRAPFERFDVDRDGFLTLEELNEKRPRGRAGRSGGGPRAAARLHRRFPNVRFRTPGGQTLDLEDLRGRIVVLIPYGTWCPPCVLKVRDYARVFRHYRDNPDVAVLIYNFKEGYGAASSDVHNNGGQDIVVLDAGDTGNQGANGWFTTATGERIKVRGSMPQAWLIDRHGIVAQERTSRVGRSGFGNTQRFCADIERLIRNLPVQSDWNAPAGYDWKNWSQC